MTKKTRKTKNNKPAEDALDELKVELTESASVESEAAVSVASTDSAAEVSVDDLLDDVRRSLIEDDADDEKKAHWWNRAAKGKPKEQDAAPDVSSYVIEKPKAEDQYLEQIDELIDLLEPEAEAVQVEAVAEPEIAPPMEPEVVPDVDELKKRVFSPTEPGKEQEISEVRAIALEGGEEVFVEVEAQKVDTFDERLTAFENSLRPYRSYIYYALAFLGIVMAVAAGALMVREYQRGLPTPVVEVSNLPFPTGMVLPGGLNFGLGKGAITDGEWNPRGAEWLEGTEICRWVAIPWSTQLEAVVRTLTRKDTIELVMSNNDRLTYTVNSIQELTLEEMGKLDSNSPCLLLVLAQQDSDKRWVVTALP
jgi:hypothetical protein